MWVYGQSELTRDISDARFAAGQQMYYNVEDVALHVDSTAPYLTGIDATGRAIRIDADVIVGCDGIRGREPRVDSRADQRSYERRYPHS